MRPLFGLWLAALLAASPAAADPLLTNCPPGRLAGRLAESYLAPLTPGPARLSAVWCPETGLVRNGGESEEAEPVLSGLTTMSPDGQAIAVADTQRRRLSAVRIGHDIQRMTIDVTLPVGASGIGRNRLSASQHLRWSADTTTLWIASQPRVGASPPGPIHPVALEGGALRDLPPLRDAPGALEALHWVGHDGLAIGLFNPTPGNESGGRIIATIDAQHGILRSQLRVEPDPSWPRIGRWFLQPDHMAATTMSDGRIRVVMSRRGGWSVWTEDAAELRLPGAPPPGSGAIAITPDGKRLFTRPYLRRLVVCVEPSSRRGPGGCGMVGGPVAGPIAFLTDIETATELWRVEGRTTEVGPDPFAIISPDNRHALLPLPDSFGDGRSSLGLLDLQDGSVVQRLPLLEFEGLGFADQGRTIWMARARQAMVIVYTLDQRRESSQPRAGAPD